AERLRALVLEDEANLGAVQLVEADRRAGQVLALHDRVERLLADVGRLRRPVRRRLRIGRWRAERGVDDPAGRQRRAAGVDELEQAGVAERLDRRLRVLDARQLDDDPV